MPLKILVTGAAGFIGSHTTDQLLAEGHFVWGCDNLRTGSRANLAAAKAHPKFSFIAIDVADEDVFLSVVANIRPDAIIHLAALVSVPESIANPSLNDRLNLHATRVVAEAARKSEVRRVVFASSAAVYGNPPLAIITEDAPKQPLSPYGHAKLASEELLLGLGSRHGFVARCLRYFNVYGPRQDPRSLYSGVISIFNDHASRGHPPLIFGDGEQTRDFISVHDVARANMIAATKTNLRSESVNICTGMAVALNALWTQMAEVHAVKIRPQYGPARIGDIRHSCGCPKKARQDLGFEASLSLAEGLRQYAAGLRGQ